VARRPYRRDGGPARDGRYWGWLQLADALAGHDEHREDEVGDVQLRLAHHAADLGRTSEPARS